MIAAVAIGLGSLDVPIPATAGMVGMSWRFLKPVRPGDSLSTKWRLNRKRAVENPDVGLVFWQIEVLNQRGEVVALGEVGRLVQRRSATAGAGHSVVTAPAAETSDAVAPETPARRRRRRGGRGGGGGAEREPRPVIAELPEPAPADTPSPSRRRRRRRGGNGNGGAAPSPTETAPPPPPVELGAPVPSAPARSAPDAGGGIRSVFRRLRGGGAED